MKNLVEFCNGCFFNKKLNSQMASIFIISVLLINCLSVDHVIFCEPNFSEVPPGLVNTVWRWYHINLHHVYQDLALNQINGQSRSFGGIYFYSDQFFDFFDGHNSRSFTLTCGRFVTRPHTIEIADMAYSIHYAVQPLIETLVQTLKVFDLRSIDSEASAIELLVHYAQVGNSPYATTEMILSWIEQLAQAQEIELPGVLDGVETELLNNASQTEGEVQEWYEHLSENVVASRKELLSITDGLENPQEDF